MCALAFVLAGCKGRGAETASKPLTTNEEKAIYLLGVHMGKSMEAQIKALELTAEERVILQRALATAMGGQPLEIDPDKEPREAVMGYMSSLQTRAEKNASAAAVKMKTDSDAYVATAAKVAGAVVLPSGLVYQTITAGSGATPARTDTVTVHYKGTLPDGTEFDSSIKRGQPAQFRLDGVIPCWTEGVGRMKVGEKAKLVCPSALAYGDRGQPPAIPGGAALVFEVELLGIGSK